MNITSSGVKGYEYQYLATVYIALNIGLNNIKSLLVEKKGSEDAFLQIAINSTLVNIEIQVKRESSKLDIPKLSDWLTHFQEGITNNNLLHRLETSDELALFITKSRCKDDTVQLIRPISDVIPHANVSISAEWNTTFVKAISEYSDNTSKLIDSRKNFCLSQSKAFEDKNYTSNLLKRVLIWEEVSDENLSFGINSMLNGKYNIPQSQTAIVQLDLLENVRKGRDEQINILPLFEELINRKRAGTPDVESDYKKRPEECVLFKELKSNNLLLLTGTSLCGKTKLAKQLAFRFFVEGYNYILHSDLQFIIQFFAQNPIEDKIAILDDPWGHLEKSLESLNDWRRIENYINNVSPNHKLIITSRREIIQEIHSTKDLNRKKLKGSFWHDLTLSDSSFLIAYWKTISQERGLTFEVIQSIEGHLLTAVGEEKLQIGQLQFLASNDKADLSGKTRSELEHIARMNSQEIGESIKNKGHNVAELMALLALTSTTTTGIHTRELAYIQSNDENNYTLIEKGFWTSVLENEESSYPKYDIEPVLSEQTIHDLEYLERRFFITFKDGYIFFTHPNYFEAGRYLFVDNSTIGQKRFLNKLKKALFAIHPDTAFLVANQFSFLAKKLSPEYFPELIEIAFEGLNSIYPAVEDRIIVFLIEFMEKLNNDQKEALVLKLESDGAPSSHIFWHEKSIPFIKTESNRWLEEFFFRMEKEKILCIENAFQKHDFVSSYTAWQYLLAVRNTSGIKILSATLETLLQYREVFLRRRAAFKFILSEGATVNMDVLYKIFSDEHPSVVFEGIRGCFMAWRFFPQIIKDQLIPLLRELLNKRPIAIRANHLMTTFAEEDSLNSIDWENMTEKEKNELWNLWGVLFPIFIKQLPLGVRLNPGQFWLTMEESFKYLKYKTGLEVLEAWYERIDHKIKNEGEPYADEMAVAEYLMAFTKNDHINRAGLFNKLVSYPVTSFLVSSLKGLILHWSNLHESEKRQILSLVSSNREDARWINAVLLNTFNNPPAEIQREILGDPNFFELKTKYIVQNFPEDLLLDCLHVYFGHPQPLWWIAVHHHNEKFWGKIIRFILYRKKDPFFSLCLRELLNNGVNGFSSWRDGFKIWRTLCRRPGKKLEIVKRLIYETASSSCSIWQTRKLWKYLIKTFQREDKEKELISLIVDYIEVLQQTGYEEDLFKFWGKEYIFKKIYPELHPDHLVMTLVEQVINIPNLETSVIPIIDKLVAEHMSFRFYFTSLFLGHVTSKYSVSENMKEILLSISSNYSVVGKEKKIILAKDLKEDISLANWKIKNSQEQQ